MRSAASSRRLRGRGERHIKHLADLGGRTVGHHHDAVGEQHGLVDVMGDHDHRVAEPAVDLHHRILQMGAGQGVERAERLVEQQDLRLHGQRPGNADALLHAAGDFRRALVLGMGHLHEVEIVHDPVVPFGAWSSLPAEDLVDGEIDVVVDGQPGQQRVVLEDDGAFRAGCIDLVVFEQDGAGGDPRQAGDQVEQGRLAAAGMADDRDELALVDGRG